MEPLERERVPRLRLAVLAQLQQHQLAGGVHDVARVERAALGLAPGMALLEVRLVAEEADALLHRHVLGVEADGHHQAGDADERLGELAQPDRRVLLLEARLDHHVLAVVRPALHERRRGHHERLARFRLHVAQVLEVQEVAGIDLVHRDRPERGRVQIAQVLLLAVSRPPRIDVGDVVVRARGPRLEGPGRPHAGERPAEKVGGRRHRHRLALGQRHQVAARDEGGKPRQLLARGIDDPVSRGVAILDAPPHLQGIARLDARGGRAELLLHLAELAQPDLEQPVERDLEALLEAELGGEPIGAEPERRPRLRREIGLEVCHVGFQRVDGLALRVGQVAQQPEIVHIGERARQIRLDEAQRAAQGLEPALHINPWRVLDVVPGRLDEARRLAQLREHPPGAVLRRGEVEQRLSGEARPEQFAV